MDNGENMDRIIPVAGYREYPPDTYALHEPSPIESKLIVEYLKQRYREEIINPYVREHIVEVIPKDMCEGIGSVNRIAIKDAEKIGVDEFHTEYHFTVTATVSTEKEEYAPHFRVYLRAKAMEDVSNYTYHLQMVDVRLFEYRLSKPQEGPGIVGSRNVLKEIKDISYLTDDEMECRKEGIRSRQEIERDLALLRDMPRDFSKLWLYLYQHLGIDLSQRKIAKLTDLSESQISKTFHASVDTYTYKNLSRILLVMHCPPLTAERVLTEAGCIPNLKNPEHLALYQAMHTMYDRPWGEIEAFIQGFVFGGPVKEKEKGKDDVKPKVR